MDIIHLKASSLQKATSLNRFPNKSTLCKTVLQVKTVFLYCTCKTNCRTLNCDHSNKWTPFLTLHRFHYWTTPGSITIVSKEHERWYLCSVWYWYVGNELTSYRLRLRIQVAVNKMPYMEGWLCNQWHHHTHVLKLHFLGRAHISSVTCI